MKGKYLIALAALGAVSVMALTLVYVPAIHAPESTAAPRAVDAQAASPFELVRVYRTDGGLVRTETLRWQGPGTMTIMTWSSTGKVGAAIPPWVSAELQGLQAQQRLLTTVMEQMIGSTNPMLNMNGLRDINPQIDIPVMFPKVQSPRKATPPQAPRRHTIDL
ncbi:MAG TPA: hypothetical protein VMV40_01845 [Acidiferrobacter sp.]|nr:hypothetical protein [Acidiferrobacter sp.]